VDLNRGEAAMPPFCKLRDPESYVPGDWDLLKDEPAREAWIRIFDEHTASLVAHAREALHPPLEEALDAYELAMRRALGQVRDRPEQFAPLTIYQLCRLRVDLMNRHHIGDPYDRVKLDENRAALDHVAQVFAAIDACPDDTVVETLLRGVLAGNKFDLGAKDTMDLHSHGGIDFFATLKELGERPWFVDDVDALAPRLARGRVAYRKAIFFVDNAGGDIVLGAIPLARYLADQGCRVVLAANDEPALNDIIVDELHDVLAAVAAYHDPRMVDHLRSGRISVVGTGCDCPLIDLGDVSDACNEAAADADLVILEGMGRAVESNYHVALTCDAIYLAMIKNRELARYLGCKLFDLVARFTPAGQVP
jgi:uncharacterized protein with ATP-grasp and redox domains